MPPNRPFVRSSVLVVVAVLALCVGGLFAFSCLVGFARDRLTHPLQSRQNASRRRLHQAPLPMTLYALNRVADPARNRRLNHYIRSCLNPFSPNVLSSHDLYRSWLGARAPSAEIEPPPLALTDVSGDPARCEEAVQAAVTMNPPDPALAAAGRRYLAALRAAATILADAYPYYRNLDWQDDGMARGRALHPILLQRYEAFEAAHSALARFVDEAQRESPVPPCVGINDGGSVGCDLAQHEALARHATASAGHARVTADGAVVGVDLPRLTAEVASLDASVRRLSALDRRLLPDPTEESDIRSYVWTAEEHLRQIKNLYRIVRDHAPVEVEQWATLDSDPAGSPQRIVGDFNRVVGDFNRIAENFTGR